MNHSIWPGPPVRCRKPPGQADRMPGTVLLVDDEPDICQTLAAALAGDGYREVWRSSAHEAFLLLDEEDFGAAVTDVRMPGGDLLVSPHLRATPRSAGDRGDRVRGL